MLTKTCPFPAHEIKRDDDVRIQKMFQDPKSHHLLVCMESKEMYYIARGGAKKFQPRLLSKFKGHFVESVAWNKTELSEASTGAILLGTNNGKLIINFLFKFFLLFDYWQ